MPPVPAAPINPVDKVDTVTMVFRGLFYGVTSAGQYILPVLLLGGAIVSFVGRGKRTALIANAGQGRAADALDGMSWQDFELLVGESFRLQGYQVTESGGAGPDGGIDLVLRKGGEKSLVQCKQWRAYKVGVQVVRELYGVMAAEGAASGFVVTSGRFTDEAQAFAVGRNVALVAGKKLFGMIKQAQASLIGAATARIRRSDSGDVVRSASHLPGVQAATVPAVSMAPACPVCSKGMKLRTAKRGGNAGGTFWGCASYPACKGTLPA